MPYRYQCPNCRRSMKIPDHLYGKAMGCPACKHPLQWDLAMVVDTQPQAAPASLADWTSDLPVQTNNPTSTPNYWQQFKSPTTTSPFESASTAGKKKKSSDTSTPSNMPIYVMLSVCLVLLVGTVAWISNSLVRNFSNRGSGSGSSDTSATIIVGRFLRMKGLTPELEVDYEGSKSNITLTDIPKSQLPRWANLPPASKVRLRVRYAGIWQTFGPSSGGSSSQSSTSNAAGERVVTSRSTTSSSNVEVLLDWEAGLIDPGDETNSSTISDGISGPSGRQLRRIFKQTHTVFTPIIEEDSLPQPNPEWATAVETLDKLDSDKAKDVDVRILKRICGISADKIDDLKIPEPFIAAFGFISDPLERPADLSFSKLFLRRVDAALALREQNVPGSSTLPSIIGLLAEDKPELRLSKDITDQLEVIVTKLSLFTLEDRIAALETLSKSQVGQRAVAKFILVYLDFKTPASELAGIAKVLKQPWAESAINQLLRSEDSARRLFKLRLAEAGGIRWLDVKELLDTIDLRSTFEDRLRVVKALRYTTTEQQSDEILSFVADQMYRSEFNDNELLQMREAGLNVILNFKPADTRRPSHVRNLCLEPPPIGTLAIECLRKEAEFEKVNLAADRFPYYVSDLLQLRSRLKHASTKQELDKLINSLDLDTATSSRFLINIAAKGITFDGGSTHEQRLLALFPPQWFHELITFSDGELDYKAHDGLGAAVLLFFANGAGSGTNDIPWTEEELKQAETIYVDGFNSGSEQRAINLLHILAKSRLRYDSRVIIKQIVLSGLKHEQPKIREAAAIAAAKTIPHETLQLVFGQDDPMIVRSFLEQFDSRVAQDLGDLLVAQIKTSLARSKDPSFKKYLEDWLISRSLTNP